MTVYSFARYEPLARDLLRHVGLSIRLAGAQTQEVLGLSKLGLAEAIANRKREGSNPRAGRRTQRWIMRSSGSVAWSDAQFLALRLRISGTAQQNMTDSNTAKRRQLVVEDVVSR